MPKLRRYDRLLRLAAFVLGLVWAGGSLAAGDAEIATAPTTAAASPAPPTTREEARGMVAALPDEDVRRLLLEHLDRSLPASTETRDRARPWLLTGGSTALERLGGLVSRLPTLGGELDRLTDAVAEDHTHPWLMLLAAMLACLGAGALLERFMLRPDGLMGGLDAIARSATAGRLSTGQVLLGGACRTIGALLFLVGAVLCLQLVPGLTQGARSLASAMVWLVAGTRLVSSAIHALLLPAGGESPWPIREAVARAVARNLSMVSALVLLKLLDRDVLEGLGASPDLVMAVALFNSLLLVGGILVALFSVRRSMGPVPDDGGRRSAWRLLEDRWHYVASAYVLAVLVVSVYGALVTRQDVLMRALASLSVVLVLPVADYVLRMLAARLAPEPSATEPEQPVLPPEDDEFAEADESTQMPAAVAESPVESTPASMAEAVAVPRAAAVQADTPEPETATGTETEAATEEPSHIEAALVLNFRLLLALALIKALTALWGIRVLDLVDAMVGAQLGGALAEIAIAGLFAFIVWQIVKAALVAHAVPESEGFDLGGDGGAAGQTRAQTLMPLVARTIGAMLILMLALIALSAFGVNIGPLLAGAGVIGLAVGFGAQTLVRDIVSGLFFLIDDAFRMGEYLQIGNIRGTVEKISVRSLRLRHHRGPLHTLPYGEIHSMTNYSRDYAIMKFEIRVPFETDVEKVRKLIKQVGAELAENEEHASVMLEPLKSQGVNRMDDSAFVIRCKFTTIPGKQFTVRRVAYAMIQEAFEREGIKFAPKRVVVETVAPPGSREALAAAAAAAQAQEEEPPRRAAGDDR